MNIGIIGLGLIGGSFGRAIIKNTEHKVYGTDILPDALVKAELLNAISAPLTEEDFGGLDLVIFALTPSQFISQAENIAPKLKKGALIIDIGGIKKEPADKMRSLSAEFPDLQFIATHPMAGKEYSGITHSSAAMFERASILLVNINAEIETLAVFKKLCVDIGFDFIKITNENEHDEIIAYTSQLCHIISSAYINNPLSDVHDGFSAGSFKDMSRVSRMNSSMWAELFLKNRTNVLKSLDVFIENVQNIKAAIEGSDAETLRNILEEGNRKKETVDKNSREWKKTNSEK